MKILVAEDDLASRKFSFKFFSTYGKCDATVDGMEALEAFVLALELGEPYDLVCLDVMMPKIDGIKVLKTIRSIEEKNKIEVSKRAKIIILTAMGKTEYVSGVLESGNEIYVEKPIQVDSMVDAMKKLNLM